jgi:hypothetical protein
MKKDEKIIISREKIKDFHLDEMVRRGRCGNNLT